MKKKTLLFGAALMLTAMFFTTSCKKTVENLTGTCYECVHATLGTTSTCDNTCVDGLSCVVDYRALSYTCTATN